MYSSCVLYIKYSHYSLKLVNEQLYQHCYCYPIYTQCNVKKELKHLIQLIEVKLSSVHIRLHHPKLHFFQFLQYLQSGCYWVRNVWE